MTDMQNEIKLGRLGGLNLSTMPSAIIGSILLWALLTGVGVWLLGLMVGKALIGGLIALVLHWGSEIFHQFGHAWAARRTGHPMVGIRLWGVLSASVYPTDEPPLPGSVHVRRALGGPEFSLLASLAGILLVLALLVLDRSGGTAWWVAVFFFLDNLLVFALGSLLPLGFNDGSTLLRWWGKP